MKKILTILLTACLLLSLAACGGAPVENPTPSQEVTYTPEQNFSFQYKGATISLHDAAEPIIAKLGEPVKYTESASCAFEGLDKSYYYGSFYLETYPQGDKDFVSGWWFADDSVTTPEGIYIGSSKAEVEKAYGTDGYNGSNAYTVNKDAGMLTIILENDVVSSIQYSIK
jgi:hypothetical protein